MNASKFVALGVAAMLGAAIGQSSPTRAMSMPPPIASDTAAELGPMPGLIVKAEHGSEWQGQEDGRAAWSGQYGQRGPGYGGYYGGGRYGSPYYAPRRSDWCYYHPYQCR